MSIRSGLVSRLLIKTRASPSVRQPFREAAAERRICVKTCFVFFLLCVCVLLGFFAESGAEKTTTSGAEKRCVIMAVKSAIYSEHAWVSRSRGRPLSDKERRKQKRGRNRVGL